MMRIIRGIGNLKKRARAVTVGNFDGIHLGHQKIIKTLVRRAKTDKLTATVVSFRPPPQIFFGNKIAAIGNFRENVRTLQKLGIDEYLIIRFDDNFSRLSAHDFVREILVARLRVRYLLVGDDFHFGNNRRGDVKMLSDLSADFDFSVAAMPAVFSGRKRISSSRIRDLLGHGDFAESARLLGREFSIDGKIIHGEKKGRTLGFPTINIALHRRESPVNGVFAVVVEIRKKAFYGVCNIGKRPTVGGTKLRLEVFIFDFDDEIYGERVRVIFKHKIRDERKFSSLEKLKQQIINDCEKGREYFQN